MWQDHIVVPKAVLTFRIHIECSRAIAGVSAHHEDIRPAVAGEIIRKTNHGRNRILCRRAEKISRINLATLLEIRTEKIKRACDYIWLSVTIDVGDAGGPRIVELVE